jgi:CBS domain-containing protein
MLRCDATRDSEAAFEEATRDEGRKGPDRGTEEGRQERGARKRCEVKVKDIMTRDLKTCSLNTNLAAAAALMLEGDCGILPVVEENRLFGVVTDRDLYIALATRDKRASDITVGQVLQAPVYTCSAEDDVHTALDTMKRHGVRRLPVEGYGGIAVGIVSMNDIALASGPPKPVRDADVVNAMQAICAHHRAGRRTAAA